MRSTWLLLVAMTACLAACSGEEEGTTYGGVAAPPLSPKLTNWTCPTGWVREAASKTTGAPSICAPPKQLSCPPGQMQPLGQATCQPVGTACPGGDFLPEAELRQLAPSYKGKIWYVKPGVTGGDGSKQTPLGSATAAQAKATKGDVVALAAGTHKEDLYINAGIAVVGACASGTVITPATPKETIGTVIFDGLSAGGLLANVRVTGARPGVWIQTGLSDKVFVSKVEVYRAVGYGVVVATNSVAELSDLAVRETQSLPSTKTKGYGLSAETGVKVTLRRAVLEGNREVGLRAIEAPTRVELQEVAIRATRQRDAATFANGLVVVQGAAVTASRLLVHRTEGVGVTVFGKGATTGQGASLTLADAAVRSSSGYGVGLLVARSAREVKASRTLIDDNRTIGVAVITDTPVTLTDTVIRRTRSDDKRQGGLGLAGTDGARITGKRVVLEGNRAAAVVLDSVKILTGLTGDTAGKPASLQLSDAMLLGTLPEEADGARGRALEVIGGAGATVERAVVEGNREVALFAAGKGTSITLRDLTVRDTLSQQSNKAAGRGLDAREGAAVQVERALLERNRELAVLGIHEGTTVALTDVVVRRTLASDCAAIPAGQPNACGVMSFLRVNGSAVAAVTKARVTLKRFELYDNAACGVLVAEASITGAEGEVHHNPVGINAPAKGFELSGAFDDSVRWFDNGQQLLSGDVAHTAFKSIKSRGLRGK